MADEKQDKRIDYKSEQSSAYAISKEKNESLRKEINEMVTNTERDRFKTYQYITELLRHSANAVNALSELWSFPEHVSDFSVETFNAAFETLVKVDNYFLDLGVTQREERKKELLDTPIMKVSQKVEDAKLGQMFG